MAVEAAEKRAPLHRGSGRRKSKGASLLMKVGGVTCRVVSARRHPPVELSKRAHCPLRLRTIDDFLIVAVSEHVAAPQGLDNDAVAAGKHADVLGR